MPRPSKLDQEMGYIRDLWNEIRTIEAVHHGMVSLHVGTLPRPGMLTMRLTFTPLMDTEENYLGVQALDFLYPNAEQSTMAGFLWRKAISLGRMVEEAANESELRPKKRG